MPQFLVPDFQLLVGLLISRLQCMLDAIGAANYDSALRSLLQLYLQAHHLPLTISARHPCLLSLSEGSFSFFAGFGNPTDPLRRCLIECLHGMRAVEAIISNVGGYLLWLLLLQLSMQFGNDLDQACFVATIARKWLQKEWNIALMDLMSNASKQGGHILHV
nr:hypothetical protein [Ktedonospora formicarum]